MGVNPELLRQARRTVSHLNKMAFVAAGDPSMGAPPGGAPGAPPMDPAMMGGGAPPGAPPMDPSMMGGGAPPMDPAMMGGGAPPMDPAAAGGGGDPMAMLMPVIQQAVQQAMAANGGGAGQGGQSGPQQGGPGLKPKIDVNVEIMQIKKMLAKIVDAMGIHIPVQDMVATPEDLNQIAQGGAGFAAAAPDGPPGGGAIGKIPPISPVKAAELWENGVAFVPPASLLKDAHETTRNTANLAAALVMRKKVADSAKG